MYVDDLRTSKEIQSKVRFKPSHCVNCTRKKSHYYEAVLQIRADRRGLSEEEMDAVYEYVNERVDSASDAFISEEEKIHGGWDFHLSSKALARNISKELASMYGAQDSSSAKLIGMKEGKELYRVTHSVRLPQYKVGDVINLEGVLYQITKMATTRSGFRSTRSGTSSISKESCIRLRRWQPMSQLLTWRAGRASHSHPQNSSAQRSWIRLSSKRFSWPRRKTRYR
jgi:nonsense-mediated mRNA decay protein 3